MKQKLIMENWRRFLNENKEVSTEAEGNSEVLTENVLAGILASILSFGSNIEVNGMTITPQEAHEAVQVLAQYDHPESVDAIRSIKGMYEDAEFNKKLGRPLRVSLDPNASTVGAKGDPLALAALEQVDDGSQSTGADTGAPERASGTSATTTFNYKAFAKMLKGLENVSGAEAAQKRIQHAQRIIKANDAGIGDPNDPEQKAVVDLAKKALAGT